MVAQVFNKYLMYRDFIAVFTTFLHLTPLSQFKPINTLMGLLYFLRILLSSHLLLDSPRFSFLSDSGILYYFSCPGCPFPFRLRNTDVAGYSYLALTLLTWRIWWAPINASKWQMGFNSAFKGPSILGLFDFWIYVMKSNVCKQKPLKHIIAGRSLIKPCQFQANSVWN